MSGIWLYGDLEQENIGLVGENLITDMVGGVDSELVGLYFKGAFTGELFANSRN